jgi:hypothetical protein
MGPLADRIVVVLILGGLATWVAWGWHSWIRCRPEQLSVGMRCSLAGFTLATVSAAFEIGTGIYGQLINGFPFQDPTLLRIYRWGFLLAFLGFVTGLFGTTKKTPLRWKAPALSAVLLLLWITAAMGE